MAIRKLPGVHRFFVRPGTNVLECAWCGFYATASALLRTSLRRLPVCTGSGGEGLMECDLPPWLCDNPYTHVRAEPEGQKKVEASEKCSVCEKELCAALDAYYGDVERYRYMCRDCRKLDEQTVPPQAPQQP